MIIDRVTITGADDSTDVERLVELAEEFPFVEWGILFSSARSGAPRFPRPRWILRLLAADGLDQRQLSAHLCGRYVRDICERATNSWAAEYGAAAARFARAQLNFHGEPHAFTVAAEPLLVNARQQFIVQFDGTNDAALAPLVRSRFCVPLFDRSGGAGVTPDRWPEPFQGFTYCGYAGGLGPDNVVDEAVKIAALAPDDRIAWIDMERNVRTTDDRALDLGKVQDVLERMRPIVRAATYDGA